MRAFGDAAVSAVGLGTWNLEREDRPHALAAIRASLDAGATHVDTAELYGSGRVEELVGEALAGRRDTAFLVSKVLPHHASRAGTVAACEASLRRLRTDHLDAYLLHWPGPHPLDETLAAFEDLRAAGKIARYGVSNFDAGDLDRAVALAGPGRIACNQVLWHLRERGIEHDVLPACRRHGVALVAYSPFGSTPAPWDDPGRAALDAVGRKHGATAHQVALAFLLAEPTAVVVPKTASAVRARENAAAADLALDPADLAAIDAAFPRGPRPRHLPTL